MTAARAVEDLLRELAPQVVGVLTRLRGDFDDAEDAVQEALLVAATQWPRDGLPDNPHGWLVAVAARRLTDRVRSEDARRRREARAATSEPADGAPAVSEDDDSLVLLFMCCHPALTPASAIALTLRAVGGLTTAEIARAFLVPEAAIAAVHDEAATVEDTDWPQILALLEGLDVRLAGHHRLDAVRAHLLEMAGEHATAITHYAAAAARTTSSAERDYLTTQAARLRARPS